MIRITLAALLLAGCAADGSLTPRAQSAVNVICQGDMAAQPIVVPVATALLPQLASAASVDSVVVHPAVVDACKRYGAKPVGVAPTVAPAVTG